MKTVLSVSTAVVLALTGAAGAGGNILIDGDFDALTFGNPPDCQMFAGAWGWPELYITSALCEVAPVQYRIVATSIFDPAALGNSLHHNVNDPTLLANFHLPNVWNESITEAEGVLVTATFDIWVITAGVSGGFVYIGGDHGGGGFDLGLDRGPQLGWQSDGNLSAFSWGGDIALPPIITPLTAYATGEWQSLRVEIDLATDTYDLFWGPLGGPLAQIADNMGFRSAALDHLDRLTVVHFGATESMDQSYLDNFQVCRGDCEALPPPCEGDANGDGIVDPLDSGFALSRFGCAVGTGDPDCDAADQNDDGIVDPLDVGFILSRFGDCPENSFGGNDTDTPPVSTFQIYIGDDARVSARSGV